MKLILFDIDGTILDSGGAGLRALEYAFEKLYGVNDAIRTRGFTSLAGKTDPMILRELLAKTGMPDACADMEGFFSLYIERLKVEVHNEHRKLMPGVRETLSMLCGKDEVGVGLLTGNIEPGARLKLDVFGLNERFTFGAYGSDHEDRNELLPYAVKRFKGMTGLEVSYKDCVVIGDTPRDVDCAKRFGAYSLAVATGSFTVNELRAAGADMSAPSLNETTGFWEAL